MSYKIEKYLIEKRVRAYKFLIEKFSISMSEAQRMIDKNRVIYQGKILKHKSLFVENEIEVILFQPSSKNLKAVFETDDFALFDKPSGVLIHPANRNTEYSLTHEIKFQYGKEANITHRIDKETSGLVLISKNKTTEIELKQLFETRSIQKGYLALVNGKLKNSLFIDEPIAKNRDFSEVKIKMFVDKHGKSAKTAIYPLEYYAKQNQTLVEAIPLTGRQHQIRVHLFHVKHTIIGDPIYGVPHEISASYLDGTLNNEDRLFYTKASRLKLHANWLKFKYKNSYKIYSKTECFT